MSKPSIDHTKLLLERLGRAAHAAWRLDPQSWDDIGREARERWVAVASAVYTALRTRGGQGGSRIEVASGYGFNTKQPYVEIELDYSPLQIAPGDARQIALLLLASAEAAESDAQLVKFGIEQIGLDLRRAAQLLDALRTMRAGAKGGRK